MYAGVVLRWLASREGTPVQKETWESHMDRVDRVEASIGVKTVRRVL